MDIYIKYKIQRWKQFLPLNMKFEARIKYLKFGTKMLKEKIDLFKLTF